jgi:hypothetical protein
MGHCVRDFTMIRIIRQLPRILSFLLAGSYLFFSALAFLKGTTVPQSIASACRQMSDTTLALLRISSAV